MGTRADFYIGRGPTAQWVGSIHNDGKPQTLLRLHSPLIRAETADEFEAAILYMRLQFTERLRPVLTAWPWPWPDSTMTDYAYAFDDGRVWCCWFGRGWVLADDLATQQYPDLDTVADAYREQVFPKQTEEEAV